MSTLAGGSLKQHPVVPFPCVAVPDAQAGPTCVLSIAAQTRVIQDQKWERIHQVCSKLASGAKLAPPRAESRAAAKRWLYHR